MLAANPGINYAIIDDTEIEPDAVTVTLAIRDKAMCELRNPRDRYNGLALLEQIELKSRGNDKRALSNV